MTRAVLATLGIATAALAAPALAAADGVKADTGSPQDVTATSATFRATVVLAALGGVTWDYGTTTAYGTTTSSVATSLIAAGQTVTLPVTGLQPNTTYHVRATASALLTLVQGKDVSFKTKKAGDDAIAPAAPAAPAAPTPPAAPAPATPAKPAAPATPPAPTKKDDNNSSPGGPAVDVSTITDDGTDGGATSAPGLATAAVTPVLGQSVALAAVAGTVTATAPAGATVSLSSAQALPTGTLIDARRGTVELKAALDTNGTTQTARFWGAQFEVRQSSARKGLTQLVLRGANFGTCATTSRSTKARASKATKKKSPARSLWGSDDHGKFETRGRGSVATVRGTRWVTTDTCDGTRTTVLKGAVSVKDLARGRTVLVTKGHSYLARTTAP